MKVFKFGGASVNSIERIKNVAGILRRFESDKILIVISAMGKTTNALEKVTEAFYENRKEDAVQLFQQVKQQHQSTANYLLVTQALACNNQLNDFFTEVEWLLHDKPVREYAYYYDQIVCIGELLSTAIVSHYLNEAGIMNTWRDVRDLIRTDNNFRDASIDWNYTEEKIKHQIDADLLATNIVLTQGFIGATDENESTTLGREGSDYTAAVFANILNAESETIWKDVESVMNADPRLFPDAVPLPELSYREVIEMAFYGAQVIHPKTIKPLQNKNIPLLVKCFLNADLEGTVIKEHSNSQLPPIIVVKEHQCMMQFTTKNFAFIGEHHAKDLYQLLEELKINPNLTQNGAIDMLVILDDNDDKIDKLAIRASELLDVMITRGLSLLTVRHYKEELIDELTKGKKIILKQQSQATAQVLLG